MIKVNVTKSPLSAAWSKFVDQFYKNSPSNNVLDCELAKHNAKNVTGTEYVEFQSYEDALAFVLKFG